MYDNVEGAGTISDEKQAIDVNFLAADVLRHWLPILLLTAATGLFAFVILSRQQEASYTSSTTIAVSNVDYHSNVEIYESIDDSIEITSIVKNVLESSELKDAIAKQLGYSSFKGSISVTQLENTNLLRITVKSNSPYTSFMEVREILSHYKEYAGILSGGSKFVILEYPKILEESVQPKADMKKVILAALVVFVGTCFALVLLSLRRITIHKGREIKSMLGIRHLGDVRCGKKEELLINDPSAGITYKESIRRIAARIDEDMCRNNRKVLLITSTEDGESKTAVAVNTAIALSQFGKKVILADMDFSNPTAHRILKLQDDGTESLDELLTRRGHDGTEGADIDADKILCRVSGTDLSVVRCREVCYQAVDRYKDTIGSLINALRERADIVIVNAAPVGMFSDAEELAEKADTSAIVIGCGKAQVRQIRESINALGGNDRVLGGILTDTFR